MVTALAPTSMDRWVAARRGGPILMSPARPGDPVPDQSVPPSAGSCGEKRITSGCRWSVVLARAGRMWRTGPLRTLPWWLARRERACVTGTRRHRLRGGGKERQGSESLTWHTGPRRRRRRILKECDFERIQHFSSRLGGPPHATVAFSCACPLRRTHRRHLGVRIPRCHGRVGEGRALFAGASRVSAFRRVCRAYARRVHTRWLIAWRVRLSDCCGRCHQLFVVMTEEDSL